MTLLFAWALADHCMILGLDELYHDLERVKYRHLEENGNHAYEQIASNSEGDVNASSIPSPEVKTMVMRVLDYVDLWTLLEIRALFRDQC
jgi:hypothetical protein